ncbi:MAG: sulfate reduction electron transfer complex DsrMKJOP subunit DsrJ [Desulfobacterales bacterium]|uniref:Sulfate reduction electron transfer complex DsrMKJOP subunit DsrJ n=1 Tax=Candidatus Desulfaltia bathyphila TaxID=2841697 RepID=A0A8J6TAY4_9BACT|nr:sulfate reduction electron transfer complex DsrMKJOP subunit DsrJ [Candidatus Desulfaltia bathyphila]MBL7194904.1 sulfate reduction electron transfer complex DsrMKJOP subunit DsrJ [Desulfobacterales bacterium]MBL7206898.1 sulfate reduction electron transfer complex DsrMKJOP subunit DsrJ [Desulfobacterales bacterium]
MNDKNIIITGLIIFFVFLTFPFWYNMGKASPVPEPKLTDKAKAAKECVEPKEYMKAEHMQILDIWRDGVVREANRVYISETGKKFNMSLSTGDDSCMGCHSNKADFCDKCHDYASVTPYCWDCHIEPPKEKK